MTKSVRYQDGQLYVHHGSWFVRYRVRVRQEDGSTKQMVWLAWVQAWHRVEFV
jgi:hypothetical protein